MVQGAQKWLQPLIKGLFPEGSSPFISLRRGRKKKSPAGAQSGRKRAAGRSGAISGGERLRKMVRFGPGESAQRQGKSLDCPGTNAKYSVSALFTIGAAFCDHRMKVYKPKMVAEAKEKWARDGTGVSLFGRKLYLSPVLDLHSGYMVSYTRSGRPAFSRMTAMPAKALDRI